MNLFKTLCFILLLAVSSISAAENRKYDPKAADDATVVFGNARFTVLTSRLIRMEWSGNAHFEDNATLGVINRNLPVPEFSVKKTGKKLTIQTSDLTLRYEGSGKFDKDNLSVKFIMKDSSESSGKKSVVWFPGMDDSANLLGTVRTLDRFESGRPLEQYDKSPISRDGWAVLDESGRHLIVENASDWRNWVAERPAGDHQDLYFFAYGYDYKEAIQDYVRIGGGIPLPPKYVFGYWWSRYWQYSDSEFIDIAKTIRGMDIPIDVMVIDMDWHYTWGLRYGQSAKDEFGEKIGWTGYTWQKDLFPDPEAFLEEVHSMNLKTSLNLHPASGIQPYEECYERFRKDYLSRTDDYDGPEGYIRESDDKWGKRGSDYPVPFRIDQKEWADAYFNSVIRPLEDMGVDFWWLDWQQWKNSKYTRNLSNTFWLNHTFFNDKVRRSESEGIYARRPLIYHRWGGLGSHRYQIGFSGDTYANWEVLGYLPYFTATASNVGYGYWGHDIGGHTIRGKYETDAELYTRWLQYGVFTPIFKTHSTKNRLIERRFWCFPEYLEPMKAAVRLRYDLSPYIYNAARQTTVSGISMCRPLYYEHPEDPDSYIWKNEYMFGDDILATVIDSPADTVTGLSDRSMWFPGGCDWYDMSTGKTYKGGTVAVLRYTVDENPWFVKAGAIIPMASENIENLQEQDDEIRFFIAPGYGESALELYEDDGCTQAYNEEFAITSVKKVSTEKSFELRISAKDGSYRNMPDMRTVTVILEGVYMPENVIVNGKAYEYSRFGQKGKYTYDGNRLATVISLPQLPVTESIDIRCEFDETKDVSLIDGKKGLIGRMNRISAEMKYVFGDYVDRWEMLPVSYMKIAQGGSYITNSPENAEEFLSDIDVEAFLKQYDGYANIPADFKKKLHSQTDL